MLPTSAASGAEVRIHGTPETPWDHITFAPPGDWVDLSPYDKNLSAQEGAHITYLLWERQVNIEAFTSFHTTAMRLETSVAVQHESQWQLNLDPRNHRLIIHWLRIVRGEQQFDALDRSRMRLIQRETQLEHLVIDGQWTLLLVLDDVRPGDIIEAAYSYVGHHPIRPDGTEAFFIVPPQIVVGRYRLRAEFSAARPSMQWKTSPDLSAPKDELLPDNRRRWTWEGSQTTTRQPEPDQPSTFLDYLWIQFSDLTDWQPLAARLVETWGKESDLTGIDAIPAFAKPAQLTKQSVQKLILSIQNEFRYLSVDLDSGGWIPASPAKVVRRRYGDCKDLSWLATNILRSWGVSARPVLVGTGLREKTNELLPMALLFNHAIIEVSIEGETRWFDLTIRQQGGDFSSQYVSHFGYGLPVEPDIRGLQKQPGNPKTSSYSLRETILLDTRPDHVSLVELALRVEGWTADNIRRARHNQGADEFFKDRLKSAQQRYPRAQRASEPLWRDNRETNVCELVETLEVPNATYLDERGERALFDVPLNLIAQTFFLPENKARRGPMYLSEPMEIRHQINIRAPGMESGQRTRLRWVQPEFTATLDDPRITGQWTKTIHFIVHQSEITPERIPTYRRDLEDFLMASSWRLYLPRNNQRPYSDPSFGQLPPPEKGADAYVPAADLSLFKDAPRNAVAQSQRGASDITCEEKRRFWIFREPSDYWRLIPLFIILSFLARSCGQIGL